MGTQWTRVQFLWTYLSQARDENKKSAVNGALYNPKLYMHVFKQCILKPPGSRIPSLLLLSVL